MNIDNVLEIAVFRIFAKLFESQPMKLTSPMLPTPWAVSFSFLTQITEL